MKLRTSRIATSLFLVTLALFAVTGLAWARTNDSSHSTQPDRNSYIFYGDIPMIGWSSFQYKFVAGTTLKPRDSATTWDYHGAGCVSAIGGNDIFNIHLDLPEGSRIDYLRIFYYDTSSSDSMAWITTYDGAGGWSDLTDVSSGGTGGYGTSLSSYVGDTVSNLNNAYVLNWRSNQTGSSMALCGLRVAYRLALDEEVYLPAIYNAP